jgi:transcriptional regulator with XRE-family HTH domain
MPNQRLSAALTRWEERSRDHTRANLARQTGISPSGISALFNGRLGASVDIMEKILAHVDEEGFCDILEAFLRDDVPEDLQDRVKIIIERLSNAVAEPGRAVDEFADNLSWLATRRSIDPAVVQWLNSSCRLLRRGESKPAATAGATVKYPKGHS